MLDKQPVLRKKCKLGNKRRRKLLSKQMTRKQVMCVKNEPEQSSIYKYLLPPRDMLLFNFPEEQPPVEVPSIKLELQTVKNQGLVNHFIRL